MLKEENTELIIDGKRVENNYTFIADDEEMKVEISYTFNASALGGKNLVTFEELYNFSNPDEPVKVAEHKDIEDDGQTVLITERIITVTDVIVWHIEQSGADTFSATYEVDQQIKEGEQTSNVKATYTVKVYVDADGDMVIVQNPTLAPAVEKSDYEPKTPEADASVDADTVNDATAFLETFFKLYPTATEKELAYYVLGNVIEPIGRDYLYSELVNPIFIKDGDNVKVKVAVKFIDNQTKATQVSQYELVLHKDSNWKIVG